MKIAVYIQTSSECSDRLSRCSDGWFYTETITTETKVFIDTKDISYNDASIITDYLKDNPIRNEHEKWKDQSDPCENIEYNASKSNELCQKFERQDVVAEEFDLGNKDTYYEASVIAHEINQKYGRIKHELLTGITSLKVQALIDLVESKLINVDIPFDTSLIYPATSYLGKLQNRTNLQSEWNEKLYPLDVAASLRSAKLLLFLLNKGASMSDNYRRLFSMLSSYWRGDSVGAQMHKDELFAILSKDISRRDAILQVYYLARQHSPKSPIFAFDTDEMCRLWINSRTQDRQNRYIEPAIKAKRYIKYQFIGLISEEEKSEVAQGIISSSMRQELFNIGFNYLLSIAQADIWRERDNEKLLCVAWATGTILQELVRGDISLPDYKTDNICGVLSINDELCDLANETINLKPSSPISEV